MQKKMKKKGILETLRMKYLRVDFFKRQKFPTKADGLAFIKSNAEISKNVRKVERQINNLIEEKVQEFEGFFENYSEDKYEFLKNVKERMNERKAQKKENLKKSLKDEILREIENENEMEFVKKYNKIIPVGDTNYSIKDMFIRILKGGLTKKKMDELKKMKDEADKAIETLENIKKQLEKM